VVGEEGGQHEVRIMATVREIEVGRVEGYMVRMGLRLMTEEHPQRVEVVDSLWVIL